VGRVPELLRHRALDLRHGRRRPAPSADDDVAIMMVEAEATESTWNLVKNEGKPPPTEEVVAEGLEAAKKFIALCEAQEELAEPRPPSRSRSSRVPGLPGRRLRRRRGRRPATSCARP
jgi:hypothetical protein